MADDVKLRETVDIFEGRVAIHRDLDSPEEWANMNLMKFYKDEYKVRHLGRKDLLEKYRRETDELESSFPEKDLGVVLDTKMSMS